jgi:ribulose 1,5-bisphosphate synthetase/thiazole synthase
MPCVQYRQVFEKTAVGQSYAWGAAVTAAAVAYTKQKGVAVDVLLVGGGASSMAAASKLNEICSIDKFFNK